MKQPIVSLVWRQAAVVRRLRAVIASRDDVIDVLEAVVDRQRQELAVAKARERRWRRFAAGLAEFAPEQARTAVQFQACSDDISDLPETEVERG